MKYYGYARISTSHQRITRQIDNIKKAYPDAVVIEEIFTGTKVVGRSAWNSLYKRIKTERAAGEEITLIFDEVSRLSRGDPEEGFQLYEELFLLGVHLVFLNEQLLEHLLSANRTVSGNILELRYGNKIFRTLV